MENSGMILGWVSIILALIICLIQIRPKPEMDLRFATKPIYSNQKEQFYTLYADVKNSGMLSILLKVKSQSEYNNMPQMIILIPDLGSFHDGIRAREISYGKNGAIPAHDRIYKLKAGENTSIEVGFLKLNQNDNRDFEMERIPVGLSRVHLIPVGKVSRINILKNIFYRKIDVDFNKLYSEVIHDRLYLSRFSDKN